MKMAQPELTVGRPLPGPLSTSSFEEEQRDLLWRRSRLVFRIGLAITSFFAVLQFLFRNISDDEILLPALAPWGWFFDSGALALAFALGLVGIHLARGSAQRLQRVLVGVMGFIIAFMLFTQVAFWPDQINYFGLSILLFLSAAFIPWRTKFQIGLGVTAALSYPLAHALTYALLPETRAFWAGRGGPTYLLGHVAVSVAGLMILAGTAAAVTRSLYNLRRTAHSALRLGNYLLETEVGSGGMGTVYVAQHAFIRRPTAVKVLQPGDEEDPAALERFEREVQLSAALTHPNTITIYDFGRTEDGRFYYAMEYLNGFDVQQLVERFGPLPPARAAHLLVQACGSLAEAHENGIIHRDIKPSNIFITRRGDLHDFVKVLDFGLAKQIGAEQAVGISQSGTILGTPRYIAPESVAGDAVDGRGDIYGLGGVAYWMLTGQPPFGSASSIELLVDHLKTVPQKPSRICELTIPAEFDAIVMKCLEKKPQDRFPTADALRG
ncbi:MAG: serine/threonine-protein kinase, partial [Gemmatimonadales bacterium]